MTERAPELVRLQKVLAASGIASRRKCEALMLSGRVEVDGVVVTRLGTRVDPAAAVIRVDGQRLPVAEQHVYLVANKPVGVVSSMADQDGRPDLRSLLAGRRERLFHAGRLDVDTEGLLVLTNDGEFANRIVHPTYQVPKTYVAEVRGVVGPAAQRRLLAGVPIEGRPVQIDRLRIPTVGADRSIVELTIHEGRNRIVRRTLEAVGHPVVALSRTAIGPIKLGTLRAGEVRALTTAELGEFLDLLDL